MMSLFAIIATHLLSAIPALPMATHQTSAAPARAARATLLLYNRSCLNQSSSQVRPIHLSLTSVSPAGSWQQSLASRSVGITANGTLGVKISEVHLLITDVCILMAAAYTLQYSNICIFHLLIEIPVINPHGSISDCDLAFDPGSDYWK
jgi:hypothetical protein